jgi:gluconate 2-dehydrogenase gamma chain
MVAGGRHEEIGVADRPAPESGAAMNERRVAAIGAAVERIVPTDHQPGAREAGTARYVLGRAARPVAAELYARGAERLDALAAEAQPGAVFAELRPDRQDSILATLDRQGDPFFRRLVIDSLEGFYGDPRHGGNDDGVSWRMLGFPGPTGGAGYRAPLGWYDANTPQDRDGSE